MKPRNLITTGLVTLGLAVGGLVYLTKGYDRIEFERAIKIRNINYETSHIFNELSDYVDTTNINFRLLTQNRCKTLDSLISVRDSLRTLPNCIAEEEQFTQLSNRKSYVGAISVIFLLAGTLMLATGMGIRDEERKKEQNS